MRKVFDQKKYKKLFVLLYFLQIWMAHIEKIPYICIFFSNCLCMTPVPCKVHSFDLSFLIRFPFLIDGGLSLIWFDDDGMMYYNLLLHNFIFVLHKFIFYSTMLVVHYISFFYTFYEFDAIFHECINAVIQIKKNF